MSYRVERPFGSLSRRLWHWLPITLLGMIIAAFVIVGNDALMYVIDNLLTIWKDFVKMSRDFGH